MAALMMRLTYYIHEKKLGVFAKLFEFIRDIYVNQLY